MRTIDMYTGSADHTIILEEGGIYKIAYGLFYEEFKVDKTFEEGTTLEEVHKYIRATEKYSDCVESEDYNRDTWEIEDWEEEDFFKEKIRQMCKA
jgi:hypothetical protein